MFSKTYLKPKNVKELSIKCTKLKSIKPINTNQINFFKKYDSSHSYQNTKYIQIQPKMINFHHPY